MYLQPKGIKGILEEREQEKSKTNRKLPEAKNSNTLTQRDEKVWSSYAAAIKIEEEDKREKANNKTNSNEIC
jgi:hypothetical protein